MDGGLYRGAGGCALAVVVIVGCACVAFGYLLRGCL